MTAAGSPRYPDVFELATARSLRAACAALARRADELAASDSVDLDDYRDLVTLRSVEEALDQLRREGHIRANMHLGIGQEAVALGAVGSLTVSDYVTGTYRGHCAALSKGAPIAAVIAEILGRDNGLSGGRGGSMHLIHRPSGLLFESAIVGGAAPIAVGAALTAQRLGTHAVSMTLFGDGATAQGNVHEALNLAGVMRLPVIFVCENNRYAEMTPVAETTALGDLVWRAFGHGIPALQVDGNDLPAVRAAARSSIEWARSGAGPVFIEALTYRFCGHYTGDPQMYRSKEEVDGRLAADPLLLVKTALSRSGTTESELAAVEQSVKAEIAQAVGEALAGVLPDASTFSSHVFEDGNVVNN